MVVLKKLKSSTLMETLVATVIIIIVFVVASMVLNAFFFNLFKSNTNEVENYLKELEYQIYNNKIKGQNTTYNYQDWEITIEEKDSLKVSYYNLIAKNSKTDKLVKKVIIKNE